LGPRSTVEISGVSPVGTGVAGFNRLQLARGPTLLISRLAADKPGGAATGVVARWWPLSCLVTGRRGRGRLAHPTAAPRAGQATAEALLTGETRCYASKGETANSPPF